MMNLKRLKGFHWNIQQAAGHNRYRIPAIVSEEIKRIRPDFGCITEYSKQAANSNEFEKCIEMLGYNIYSTQAPKGQNDVLIFVDKKYKSSQVMAFIWNEHNEVPNYLEVLVEGTGFTLTVVGTRIRVLCNGSTEDDCKFRVVQMKKLNNRLEAIVGPTVVLGDFNGREKWMYQNYNGLIN